MNFNDDDSILYDDEEVTLRQPPPPGPFYPQNNFPQGGNMNIGQPPNYTPSKNSPGVKSFNSNNTNNNSKNNSNNKNNKNTKAVSPGSISFCLYKFTYIWEKGNRSYWAYLLNVDKKSISGFRWFRGTWVYFGLDLNRVDSFVCYRSNSEDCNRNDDDNDIKFARKQYTNNKINNIYFKVLENFEVIESRNDFLTNYIGEVDGNEVTAKIPCKQSKITNYRIVLEISYPESFNKDLINEINKCANEASNLAIKHLNTFRDTKDFLTPIEVFNNTTKNINKSIKVFSDEFNNKLKKLKTPKENLREVKYSISEEKIEGPWRLI